MAKKIFRVFLWIIGIFNIWIKLFMKVDAFTSSVIHLISYGTLGLYAIYTGYSSKELHVKVLGISLVILAALDFLL